MYDVIMKAFGQTVYMVIGSTLFSVILGFIPAIVLTVIALDGLRPNKIIYGILDILCKCIPQLPIYHFNGYRHPVYPYDRRKSHWYKGSFSASDHFRDSFCSQSY